MMKEPYAQMDQLFRDYLSLNGENRFKLAQFFHHLVRSQREEEQAAKEQTYRTLSNLEDEPLSARCSFCGKTAGAVRQMVQGPGVRICDQCVALCGEVLSDGFGAEPPKRRARKRKQS